MRSGRPKLATAVWTLLVFDWLIILGSSGYLIQRLRVSSDQYNRVIARQAREEQAIAGIQADFRRQVEAWKNTLEASRDPDPLGHYAEQLSRDQGEARERVAMLERAIEDPEALQALAALANASEQMGARYATALADFVRARQATAQRIGQVAAALERAPPELERKLGELAAKHSEDDAIARKTEIAYVAAVLGLFFVAAAAAVALFLRRHRAAMRRTAGGLAADARQIHAAAHALAEWSESLAATAAGQGATIEAVIGQLAQAAGGARRTAEASRTAADLTADTAARAQSAARELGQMIESIQQIHASSKKISGLVRVIDEIAFQTNLLALNAAVEAARAGQSGVGFGVVADEMRNLAQRCAQAARDTAGLVGETIQSANGGRARLDAASTRMQAVAEGAAKANTVLAAIRLDAQEQAAAAATGIREFAGNTASGAGDSLRACNTLRDLAQSVRQAALALRDL